MSVYSPLFSHSALMVSIVLTPHRVTELHHGLLLPPVLGGQEALLRGLQGPAGAVHRDVEENLETRHIRYYSSDTVITRN